MTTIEQNEFPERQQKEREKKIEKGMKERTN